jgi:5-methylcytosine-specific restriction protein A
MTSSLTRRGSTARWRRIREAILVRDHHTCMRPVDGHLCGAHATTVGHIVRREHGGTDEPVNLRAECATCNYGERPPAPAAIVRPSLTQLGIARVLDTVGLPTTAGRRQALEVLAVELPLNRFRSSDVDAACRHRRARGPLTRA